MYIVCGLQTTKGSTLCREKQMGRSLIKKIFALYDLHSKAMVEENKVPVSDVSYPF